MPSRNWLLRSGAVVMLVGLCSTVSGCTADHLIRLTVVNPCGFSVVAQVWSVPRVGVLDATEPPDDEWTIEAHDSLTFLSLPSGPLVVRIDELGFRQELIAPPGGELSDAVVGPDATYCGG